MTATLPPHRSAALRPMVDAALAQKRPFDTWPRELQEAYLANRRSADYRELRFMIAAGMVVALVSILLDFIAIPEIAAYGVGLKIATIIPLNVAALVFLDARHTRLLKIVTTLSMSMFAMIVMNLASFAPPEVAARFAMGTALLLAASMQVLPFTLRENGRHALFYCLCSIAGGIWPNPLPPGEMLQHIVIMTLVGAGSWAILRRFWELETRNYLLKLSDAFSHAELKRNNALLRELSESDPLTGLPNRRFLERIFEEYYLEDKGHPVALMMIDIDHFKAFNDRHGHQAGDACLMQVARALDHLMGKVGGHVARYGGEEFVVVLHETPGRPGKQVAEDVRRAIEAVEVATGSGEYCRITASVGTAASDGERPPVMGELIARADEALYRAKQLGRNRVESAYAPVEAILRGEDA